MVPVDLGNHKYKVQVLDRAFSLFEVLASSSSLLTASELCARARLNKTAAHRLLTTLERYRSLEPSFAERLLPGSRINEQRSPELIRSVPATARELSAASDLVPFLTSGKLALNR